MINVSQTIKNSCKADKNTHREYIVINNQIIDIKGKLNATAYKDTTFFGTFNMKVLEFETSNDTQFRNRQFEYYKVIDGNAFKIGTFITTEVVDNDSKETIKVTANDYGLKFAVPYTTSLDYTTGTITLFQVLQECCTQVGITLRNESITNGDFVVDSNQFVNDELVGDVVSAIAGISGNFATIDENDKLYLLFANNTGNLITKDIEQTDEITNFNELNDFTLKGKTTQDGTPTPSNPIEVETRTGLQTITTSNLQQEEIVNEINLGKNLFDIDYMIEKNYKTNGSEITNYYTKNSDGSLTINRDNDTYGRTFFNKLTLQSGTYTLSFNASVENGTYFRRSIRNMITLTDIVSASSVNVETYPYYTLTFTLSEQTTIGISLNPTVESSTLTISNIQLENGSVATEYSKYFTPIELCDIGDYQDYIYRNNGKWYLHKETKKIVLDGTQSSSSVNTSSTNTTRVQYNHYADGGASIYAGYSNLLTFQRNWSTDIEGFSFDSSNGGFWFRINKTTIGTTASEVNTYLSNNNLICYIPLATPTDTEITNTELINQLENIRLFDGYNYIVSSLPIEIKYYDDNGEVLKDYSDLNDKRDTQPITSVSIGNSQIQGQEAILRDTELIEEYGEHWLTINDNPFAYTLEKRQQLVTAIFNKVKGFGYSSFTSKYTYRPYLSLGDKIKFKNKAGQLIDSIILRYNMDYDDCTFEAPSITSSTINYELSPSPEETAKRAEIIANQAEAKITSVVSKVDEVEVTVYGEYELTKDTTYQEDKTYYVFDGTDYIEFTDFEVGDTIPANTIYERDETSSLEQRMQQAEQTLTEQGLTLEIKTSKIDDEGNTTSFKTTNYILDENGFEIDDGSGYKSLSTTTGQYYYDNDVMVGKYTKDIAVHKDLALYGKYYYGIDESVDVENFSKDDAMFMAQMYEAQWEDEYGTTQTETGLGHFYNMD